MIPPRNHNPEINTASDSMREMRLLRKRSNIRTRAAEWDHERPERIPGFGRFFGVEALFL